MTTANTTSPSQQRHYPGRNLLLKALAVAALAFSLSGCIPIPVMEYSPSQPTAGESITFDGTGTIVSNIPEDTVVASYRWTFGDGSTGSGATATHVYAAAGTYEVTLKAIDSAGRVGETMETITVGAAVETTETESESTSTSTTTSTDATSTETTTATAK